MKVLISELRVTTLLKQETHEWAQTTKVAAECADLLPKKQPQFENTEVTVWLTISTTKTPLYVD